MWTKPSDGFGKKKPDADLSEPHTQCRSLRSRWVDGRHQRNLGRNEALTILNSSLLRSWQLHIGPLARPRPRGIAKCFQKLQKGSLKYLKASDCDVFEDIQVEEPVGPQAILASLSRAPPQLVLRQAQPCSMLCQAKDVSRTLSDFETQNKTENANRNNEIFPFEINLKSFFNSFSQKWQPFRASKLTSMPTAAGPRGLLSVCPPKCSYTTSFDSLLVEHFKTSKEFKII